MFKTVADPFAGRITVFKIFSGSVKADATVYNCTKNTQERLGPLHVLQGKALEKISEAHAGDIIAVAKLRETTTGDTFCDKANPIVYDQGLSPYPHGIAFYGGYLYIALENRVIRYPYRAGDVSPRGPAQTIIGDLPVGQAGVPRDLCPVAHRRG